MDLNKYLNNAAPSEPQYSKEDYAAMKKTEREAVWAQVDARMGEVLADAPALQEFLNFMSQCRNSLPNQLLLSGQNADITDARTFQQWKDAGRHIRTGEEGYTAIVGQVYENNGRKASGYNIGKVFDITQTRGRPIPPPAEYQVDELIAATIESSPVAIQISDSLPDGIQAQYEASVKQFLYTELMKLPQDELLGFDCVWQSYRNKANFPKMVAAACIINDGSSDDRFTDFRNWLIMQGYDAYRQAMIDPDNLAALNIPFRDTEWMGCGNVAWYAYAGQKLRIYFEKAGVTAELHRKYPTLLKSSADLHQAIMQEQLAPCRAAETEWERQMLRTEVKHYIEVSDLAYSYNKFYAQNMPDKVAWETLQSDLFANLPQIKAERMPRDFSVVLPKLWRKRQAWNAERTKRPPYRGEER